MQADIQQALLPRAGYLVDTHAMCWVRTLASPVTEVWQTVSTLAGLQKWWLSAGDVTAFELEPGGVFAHHWSNAIESFKELEYIDFRGSEAAYTGTGGMRFELVCLDERTTRFAFLDTWGPSARLPAVTPAQDAQPGGPGTPWSGVAAGWHAMLDRLEIVLGGSPPIFTYEALCDFYGRHLTDLYRWREMVQKQ